ncbi:MAG: YggT family protein [Alphaproteobacteria bacterium]|nr:YggT family protein [Alphaproteobacteria bacterium]MDE2340291.1 YggT family protein [Alphaproteobacteria bacterium]
MIMLVEIIDFLLRLLWWVILIQAVMSWLIAFNVINTYNETVRTIWNTLSRVLEPIYRPIRKIMPDFGALDLSPMVVLIGIYMMQAFVLPAILRAVYGEPF